MENNNQQSFWQFSDQLRHQTNNLANLSLNDSIWSNSYVSKRPQERRNFDVNVGGEFNSVNSSNSLKANESDLMGSTMVGRLVVGLPPRYRDSVRAITPGLPLFLYNYSTHQLHGIFEAASFGGTNIDPKAWEDKKNPGESRFRSGMKVCEPLEEDSFRPILHHYDGPKFRLELNIPEALSLLDIFAENDP
ncbi:hypothetical protein LOK49_LG13G00977 [Camellia lanceoleosa]|uniref:Uncharacterized protein n=1 Tax=Camellia lanceoleosa TaxID=1840588 RepID=A0ACC0FMZ5_9ERIC|nr:hypothetical protein LOK49_LG13G00977 [Camellia lanceoleosa]